MWAAGPSLQAGAVDNVDPFSDNVTLFLPLNGTAGSTNTVDLSSYGHVCTPNGGAAYSSAAPIFGGTALATDGSGDFISVPFNANAFDFGTGDFTIELWFYATSDTTDRTLISAYASASAGWCLVTDSSSRPYFNCTGDGVDVQGSTGITTGKWYHVAVARGGGVLRMFLDGVQIGSSNDASNIVTGASTLYVGRLSASFTSYDWQGYLYGVRITKGVCRYTSAFTPAAYKPLGDRRAKYDILSLPGFADSSGEVFDNLGRRWLKNGNAALSATQSRFGLSALYLDGNGDFIYTPDDSVWDLGTGDFTIEAWIYMASTPSSASYMIVGNFDNTSGNPTAVGWGLQYRTDVSSIPRIRFLWGNNTTLDAIITLGATTWYHVAAVRKAGVLTLFLNGSPVATGAWTTNMSGSTRIPVVGALYDAQSVAWAQYFNGYINNVRISSVARYSVPAPGEPSNDPGTVALLSFENGLTDAAGKTWTANGNAAVSSAHAKFGTQSLYLDGNGDWIDTPDSADFAFGAGDFTVEAWLKSPGNGSWDQVLGQRRSDGSGTNSDNPFGLTRATTDNPNSLQFGFFNGSGNNTIVGSRAVFDDAWHHVAIMRKGTVFTLLIDGYPQGGFVSTASSSDSTTKFSIGRAGDYNGQYYKGYIDGVRITKGYAKYSFNTQQAPYYPVDPHYKKVVSHLVGNGANSATTIADDKGIQWTNANVNTSTTQGRFRGSSMGFNGSSAYLDASNSAFATGTEDFTWEAWVYSNSTGAWSRLVETSTHDSANKGWHLSFNGSDGSGSRRIGWQLSKSGGGGSRLESDSAFPNASWAHIAITRENNVGRMYVDGHVQSTTLDLSAETWSQNTMRIGATLGSPSNYLGAYVSDVRFTRGLARYKPVPTEAPAVVPGTVSLLNFDGANGSTTFTDSLGSTWTAGGDAKISTAQSKFGGSSLLLDGSGDFIYSASNSLWDLGTWDYTIEMWVYMVSLVGGASFISRRYSGAEGWHICTSATGQINYRMVIGGSWQDGVCATPVGSLTTGAWTHLSFNRRGSNFWIAINGVRRSTYSNAGAINDTAQPLSIGRGTITTTEYPFNGYIDGFRFVKGRTLYGSPTAPHPRHYGKV